MFNLALKLRVEAIIHHSTRYSTKGSLHNLVLTSFVCCDVDEAPLQGLDGESYVQKTIHHYWRARWKSRGSQLYWSRAGTYSLSKLELGVLVMSVLELLSE